MGNSESPWSTAQARERRYYESRSREASHDGDQPYTDLHETFWRAILDKLPELQFKDTGCYVDVGCGPNSILAFVSSGRRIGIDPLMDFYKESFRLPAGVENHTGTIEQMAPVSDGEADIVFSMNNIDHIKNLYDALDALHRKLKPGGKLVVSVNIVCNPVMRVLSGVFDIYRYVDPTHTYHFHSPEAFVGRLAKYFRPEKYESIEDLADDLYEKKKEKINVGARRSRIRDSLKWTKNRLILREKLYLFLFSH